MTGELGETGGEDWIDGMVLSWDEGLMGVGLDEVEDLWRCFVKK